MWDIIRAMTTVSRIRRIAWIVVLAAIAAIVYDKYTNVHPRRSDSQALEGNSAAGETVWVTGNGLRLKTRVYRSADAGEHPTLVVVLHGDSPFDAPSYQYVFARRAAEQIGGLIAAGVLRPGYTDDTGATSDGSRGEATGDNYTPTVVDAVAEVTRELKAKYAASHVILAGHSGGAAIAGDLIGRAPDVAEGALLVSCPCDVGAFRKHMAKKQMNPLWLAPVESLSPLNLIPSVPQTMHVRIVVGTEDSVTPVRITREYAAGLRARGVDVRVVEVPGAEHDIFLEPVVFDQLKSLVKTMEGAAGN